MFHFLQQKFMLNSPHARQLLAVFRNNISMIKNLIEYSRPNLQVDVTVYCNWREGEQVLLVYAWFFLVTYNCDEILRYWL